MKTILEDISPVKKKLMIEIEADEVNKRINKAYRELGKRAKVRGFRPGKIPRKILESYFGTQVVEDVTRTIVRETLPKALEETKTFPLAIPAVENETIKEGQNFKYSALMEVRPEFELKDYAGLKVEKEKLTVNDEDFEKQVEEIRKARGKLNSISEDRSVKEDDYVIIEYEGFEGDGVIEGIKSNNFLLNIGSGDFHPDFEEALIGRKKGDKTDIKVNFEADHYHSKLAGKIVNFKVELMDIKVMELPELNDEFARNLGADFNDLDDFNKKVREDLITREEQRIDKELKKRLLNKISESVDIELPQSLVESEINYAIENIRQNLIRTGSNFEKAGLREEKLKEEFRPTSEIRVKELLILGEIARQNDLNINELELSEGFREMATRMAQDHEIIRKYYEANNLVDSFQQKLLEEKTLNYLVEGAKISEVEADAIHGEQP
jgi:trigger factor